MYLWDNDSLRIGYHGNYNGFRVEVGSNTSTVALRKVGDDEKGRFETGRLKHGRELQGLGSENDCTGEDQQQL
jgi:hypothetical protein